MAKKSKKQHRDRYEHNPVEDPLDEERPRPWTEIQDGKPVMKIPATWFSNADSEMFKLRKEHNALLNRVEALEALNKDDDAHKLGGVCLDSLKPGDKFELLTVEDDFVYQLVDTTDEIEEDGFVYAICLTTSVLHHFERAIRVERRV